ncbi:MAG: DMT family transporter [Victivallaceae bacterium]|nr:DMT family transporter [Victivallaceae bacterium]
MITGIILGLGAALFQSFSYLMSRHFIQRHGSPIHLLIASHIIMGGMALILLPFVYQEIVNTPSVYISQLIQCAGFFLLGQVCFFMALKNIESSRLSPLLGLKIIIIALISWCFYGESFVAIQWVAVIICFIGAIMTNWSGSTIPFISIIWIIGACTFYSFSDINIKALVDIFGQEQLFNSALLAASLNYIICGIVAIVFFVLIPNQQRWKNFKPAMPFALCWFAGMLFLFGCFGSIGPVFGNIIQSSRGIMSVIIGFLIAKAGHHHLESTTAGHLVIKRIIAAILMLLAVAMFAWK